MNVQADDDNADDNDVVVVVDDDYDHGVDELVFNAQQ